MNALAQSAAAADETTTTPDGIVLKRSMLHNGRAKLSAALVQVGADATDHAVVYDPITGLMEAVNAPGFLPTDGDQYPDELIARAKALSHAGHSDWVIPHVQQGIRSVDYSKTGPAADMSLYPDAIDDWYLCQETQWSIDEERAGDSRSFWYVNVDYGLVSSGGADYRFRARPVRVAAPAGQWLVIGQ